jgi:hypothetical protein
LEQAVRLQSGNDGSVVRRPSSRGARIACTLNATDGVGDVGQIDQSGSGDDFVDLTLDYHVFALGILFNVDIKVFWIKEEGGPNAFFHQGTFPSLHPYARFGTAAADGTDGSVFLGTTLMRSELRDGRPYAFSAIVGHEFGHAMQQKRKCELKGKWREMHADYMAGYYVGVSRLFQGTAPLQSCVSLYHKGDYNFNDVGHHGTPMERARAFEAGYQFGRSKARDMTDGGDCAKALEAYRQGLVYIEGLKSTEDEMNGRLR